VGKRSTKAKGQCIAKGPDPATGRIKRCLNPIRSRGLCRSCYDAAYEDIRTGKTTWQQLEAEGKALPSNVTLSTYTLAKRSHKRKAVS
jgi:hypothetical protein